MKVEELSDVILTTDLPEFDLRTGDMGIIVMIHQGGAGYTVEFTTLSGATIVVVTLAADQVRPTRANGIAHARQLPPTA